MRRLATVQQISELRPIEGADAIEVARINGWDVVVKKGDFKTDEMVVFCEVDSFLPIQPEYEFLRKSSYKKMSDGTEGFRLRTIRLRGQLSQGLLINYQTLISKLPPDENGHVDLPDMGEDVTEIMGIVKYEPPVPACLAGQVKGNFPGFLHKTDEERCCDQNTMIETADGLKTIKEICELKYSGRIKSYNHDLEHVEYRNILNWSIMTRKINSWIKIKTKSGKELIVTDNHKVFIENDECYRESKYLKIGDKLNISKKERYWRNLMIDEIVSIEYVKNNSLRYDITVEDNHNFYANDILVHNCQNIKSHKYQAYRDKGSQYYITEKLDGSSCSIYLRGNEFGVCSRNMDLKETEGNTFWKVAREQNIEEILRKHAAKTGQQTVCVQGELVGEGVQGNIYNIKGHDFYIYNLYYSDCDQYAPIEELIEFTEEYNLKHVPLLYKDINLPENSKVCLELSENKSKLNSNTEREGIVIRYFDRSVSFKAISNKFLEKKGD